MKRLTLIAVTVALAVSVAGIAAACPRGQGVDRRVARQELRIHRGMRAGQLTRGERCRLQAGERHIRRMELRAGADGRIGPRERVRLHRALDRQSGRIWRMRHNGRVI
jgi:hypothetical protein